MSEEKTENFMKTELTLSANEVLKWSQRAALGVLGSFLEISEGLENKKQGQLKPWVFWPTDLILIAV